MKRILIAADGSPAAAEAVTLGIELAAEQEAQATFVHVMPAVDVIPTMNMGYGLPGFQMAFGLVGTRPHEATRHDHAPLEDAAAVASRQGVSVESALLTGGTVDEIVAYGDSLEADLIIVGSRGHNSVVTTLLGSVSRGILRKSGRPVLVVRSGRVRDWAATASRSSGHRNGRDRSRRPAGARPPKQVRSAAQLQRVDRAHCHTRRHRIAPGARTCRLPDGPRESAPGPSPEP